MSAPAPCTPLNCTSACTTAYAVASPRVYDCMLHICLCAVMALHRDDTVCRGVMALHRTAIRYRQSTGLLRDYACYAPPTHDYVWDYYTMSTHMYVAMRIMRTYRILLRVYTRIYTFLVLLLFLEKHAKQAKAPSSPDRNLSGKISG